MHGKLSGCVKLKIGISLTYKPDKAKVCNYQSVYPERIKLVNQQKRIGKLLIV
jgi:hypothetical protein